MQTADKQRRTPVQVRAREKVELVTEAAAQILVRDGEDGLTTNAVAARAGVSIGTLYQYFENKEAILLAVIERERLRGARRVKTALAAIEPQPIEATVREIVRILVDSFALRLRARRTFLHVVLRLAAARNEPTEFDEVTQLIAMESARRGHPLTKVDAFMLTRGVMAALRAAALSEPRVIDEPDFEPALVDLILGFLDRRLKPVEASRSE